MVQLNVNDPEYVPKYSSEFSASRAGNIVVLNFFYDDIPCGTEPATSKIVSRVAMPIDLARALIRSLSSFIGEEPHSESNRI